MYYWTCPDCGANLDPGERCDCKDTKKSVDIILPGALSSGAGHPIWQERF